MTPEALIPNAKPQIVDDAIRRNIDLPLAHYAHPTDPSQRAALCGAEILGVAASKPYALCATCAHIAGAVDWSLLPEEHGGGLPLSPRW